MANDTLHYKDLAIRKSYAVEDTALYTLKRKMRIFKKNAHHVLSASYQNTFNFAQQYLKIFYLILVMV
jgi:hypothetical protein